MCIKGNPQLCPKPCPSVSFCINPIEIPFPSYKGEEKDGIFSCEEQTQPVESLSTSEVEFDNLSESDIDPFETIYGEMPLRKKMSNLYSLKFSISFLSLNVGSSLFAFRIWTKAE